MTFSKDIDFVALCAFLLALLSALTQLDSWVRGPRIAFLGPDRIALFVDTAPDGKPVVRVAAPLSYVNTAEPSYAAVLAKERVTLEASGAESHQTGNSFGSFPVVDGKITVRPDTPAVPVGLAGQSAISHITLFGPVQRVRDAAPNCDADADYLSPDRLSPAMKPGGVLHLSFDSEFFGAPAQHFKCDVRINADVAKAWAAHPELPFYLGCHAADKG